MKLKLIVILLVAGVMLSACGKKKEDAKKSGLKPTGVRTEYTLAEQPSIPEGFALNGIRLNDTTNNVRVLAFSLQPTKKEIKTNLKPTYEKIEQIVKRTLPKVKNEPRIKGQQNYLYIQVKSFEQVKDSLKCVYLIKEKFISSKDTISYFDSVIYKAQ
ncbi:MAG: hypothetical protein LBL74_05335 [Bacteroidales bacterium]|jgi:hypothetical protein|nr:hypothetical protein [Bacteroidales bacterium]